MTRFALVADPEFSWMHDLFPPFRLAEARGVPVDRAVLVNLLNHVHFSGRSILVHLPDPAYPQGRFESVRPQPCSGDELVCRRLGGYGTGPGPRPSGRIHLLIDQGRSAILVPATVRLVEGDTFSLRLPACGYVVGERGNRRYSCRGVAAHVMDGDLPARGDLLDFSPHGFRVGIGEPVEGFGDPRGGRPVLRLCLWREKEVVFSGVCTCVDRRGPQWRRELILVPVEEVPPDTEESRIRNPRQRLVPSPTVLFEHPLLEKTVQMEVSDLSTAGMCVHETPGRAKLVRGLIIPELFIDFGTRHRLKAAAEVVYRREEAGAVRCGMAIRDMTLEHYSRLAHILTHALDPHTYISSDVDMDGLWSFFFRSGFIYPEKYRRIHARRRSLERTYRRLYQESPEIARHFTYQRNGTIYGHMSMLRAYSRSWMIQHHAAVNLKNKRPGFAVLKQIMQYLQDIHRLPSAQTRYVMCYFRPENKFPDRIFGGFARSLDDPRICSLDRFAYLPELPPASGKRLPEPWRLTEVSPLVLEEVKRFYGERSDGLLPDVLDLSAGESEALEALYRKAGFERRCSSRALVRRDEIYAVFIVNRSEFGLNLSSFVNNFKIIVLRPDQLPWDVLSCAIGGLGVKSELQPMPAMIYPHDYAWNRHAGYDRQYCLWAYDLRYVHCFKEFLYRKYRVNYWK